MKLNHETASDWSREVICLSGGIRTYMILNRGTYGIWASKAGNNSDSSLAWVLKRARLALSPPQFS